MAKKYTKVEYRKIILDLEVRGDNSATRNEPIGDVRMSDAQFEKQMERAAEHMMQRGKGQKIAALVARRLAEDLRKDIN